MIIYKVLLENKFVGSTFKIESLAKLISKLKSAFPSAEIQIHAKYIHVQEGSK